ncbi:hypothetical protein wVul_0621 [Wolbachia endosymbiont of Armadillidium vulgare str. wVulC]|uniref:hypothetical protein n=1 Tax=Wolbachia endosymbiont of Armadillidium vulgare TaxID=77039 RepID=UPI0006D4C5F7|nr:hypothetical protein [Wolbachia endosymbiont of Armadillidium vulgare]KLT23418.1 hypothetical protein wVul_0621 [Wolbachia endosymbiont of Armadillidium vulgare str. wVulC]
MTNQERQQRSISNAKKPSSADFLKTMRKTIPVLFDTSEQDKKSSPVQTTVDDMFFGGISDSTPCLTPQRSEASTTVLKVPGVIHTTTRKNNVGSGLNELNARKKANFVAPELSIAKKKVTSEYHITPAEHRPTLSEYMMQKEREAKESNPFKTLMETMPVYYEPVYKNVDDTFEQDKKSPPVQATVDDMFFGGINDSTPCLTPEKSQATTTDELETVKFLKTSSKAERENLGFSPKQQDDQKVEVSTKAYNPLDWNPIYQGKKRFSPRYPLLHNNAEMHGNITSAYSIAEKCMVTRDGNELEAKMERKHGFQQDLNVKHTKADTVVCSITKGNDKKDIRLDDSYKQEPTSKMSKVNVRELANRFRKSDISYKQEPTSEMSKVNVRELVNRFRG